MIARHNSTTKRPCFFCGEATLFTIELVGARGARRTVDCCVDCGERPGKRERLLAANRAKEKAA